MATYTVIVNPGADNETQSTHRTWGAAFNAGRAIERVKQDATIEIVERDRDGERTYNLAGKVIGRRLTDIL